MNVTSYTPKGDGGPAFPVVFDHVDARSESHGMTLRDWFAAHETLSEWDHPKASLSENMCEALAGRPKPNHGWSCETPEQWLDITRWDADWRAALKYIRSDAMLKARDK